MIFFKVTNIEYEVMPQPEPFNPDFYRSSTLGELGCWVDSTITRIIQAGLEHSRVPDTRSYMQLGSHRFFFLVKKLNPVSEPTLCLHQQSPPNPQGTLSKLFSLASAALSQRAVDYNLSLSFLLKGERGVGKFTIVSSVAQQLGYHISEVSY